MPTIHRINQKLSGLADGIRIRYLIINHLLADSDGRFVPNMSEDGLHLSLDGYQHWATTLHPIPVELLGPRAETDLHIWLQVIPALQKHKEYCGCPHINLTWRTRFQRHRMVYIKPSADEAGVPVSTLSSVPMTRYPISKPPILGLFKGDGSVLPGHNQMRQTPRINLFFYSL